MIRKSCIIILFAALNITKAWAVSLDLSAQNILDGQSNYKIEFGTVSADTQYKSAGQYITVGFQGYSDVALWKMDVYTNNASITSSHQKSGLVNIQGNNVRVPLRWKVVSSSTAVPSETDAGWRYLSDKNDTNNPLTTDDESWENSRKKGDSLVCYGRAAKSLLSGGVAAVSPVYMYIQGDFRSASAGNYEGTIWFDIYPVLDVFGPAISHAPVSKVIGTGNKLFIEADITGDWNIQWAKLHYRINDNPWQQEDMILTVSTGTHAAYALEPGKIKGASSITYAIEVYDGWNDPVWFKTLSAPQNIDVASEVSFDNVSSGQFIVPDGNPYDGNTKVVIPQNALDAPVNVSIRKLESDTLPGNAFGVISGKDAVAAYDFQPDGLQFKKPAELTILYYDLDNDGLVELADGTETAINENDLTICWWDGFEWRYAGGKVDTAANTVTVLTSHFSMYALFAADDKTADDYRPAEKIITPATPGNNDIAYFGGLAGTDFNISIYDANGRKVRTLSSSQMPQWDGRDDAGSIVESGIYIYQFKATVAGAEKLISGTIIVAK